MKPLNILEWLKENKIKAAMIVAVGSLILFGFYRYTVDTMPTPKKVILS